ncbi:MAG TPA: serine protease [Candidatus Paceibacterota bacterium]|nr:serine protease [Verrucomicrobiota bacterium]HSA12612.1 serine protease [Candidatus Paceibacterota bacterium]
MRCLSKLLLAALLLVLAGPGFPGRADELAQKGRDIFKKNQHAVVTVQVVLKMSYSGAGKSSENRQEITGTVVDGSGLTVLALSACDPSEMYQRMLAEQSSQYKLETEVTDLKILLEDGTELPAEIVLRDKDLDLAFIRPKTKPASPMAAVDFAKSSPAQLLDQVVTLNRLNSAAGRAYAASVERVSAVLQRPRTFYIPDSTMTSTTLGSPAFALDGNIVGVMVMRAINAKAGSGRNYRDNMTTIILPAEDILKAARQAPEAKGEPEKKDSPGESKESK